MRIYYDREEDILYLRLREEPIADSVDYEEGVTLHLDDRGRVIGVEVMDARERVEETSDLAEFVSASTTSASSV